MSPKKQAEFLFQSFLKNNERSLALLQQYSSIKSIFIKYNTTLPSSASVERMFSVASDVFKTKRHALTDANFETQLLLKLNKNYSGLK